MHGCHNTSGKKKSVKICSYKCNEFIVFAPLCRVISYVRSQRSCRNSSNALAGINVEETLAIIYFLNEHLITLNTTESSVTFAYKLKRGLPVLSFQHPHLLALSFWFEPAKLNHSSDNNELNIQPEFRIHLKVQTSVEMNILCHSLTEERVHYLSKKLRFWEFVTY